MQAQTLDAGVVPPGFIADFGGREVPVSYLCTSHFVDLSTG